MIQSLQARFRAIEILQRLRNKHPPGTRRFDEIDHAIDLVLQSRRAIDPFLVRNVLRDAERIVRRRQKRQRLTLETNLLSNAESTKHDSLVDIVVDEATPEAELSAAQITGTALASESGRESRRARILECLIGGCTTREIAKMLGISPALASTQARRIKDAVLEAAVTLP